MKTLVNKSKVNKTQLLFGVFFLFIIIAITFDPARYSAVALNGILVWAKILLPALLPFFILTKLFSKSGMIEPITAVFQKPFKKLYNCPKESSYVFLMSIITGYPVGSKLVADLYMSGTITKAQAIRTTAFTSNSGPMFILGSVAVGMFASKKMGYIILISHIIGALLNGLLYRNIKGTENTNLPAPPTIKNQQIDFADSVSSSISSILLIGGVVCFAFVLLEVITTTKIFSLLVNFMGKLSLNKELFSAIFCGVIEITKGCLMLSGTMLAQTPSTLFATFIISFGGISTLLQAMAFLKGIVPTKTFVLQKFTHAILSTLVCFLMCLIL